MIIELNKFDGIPDDRERLGIQKLAHSRIKLHFTRLNARRPPQKIVVSLLGIYTSLREVEAGPNPKKVWQLGTQQQQNTSLKIY
jgi:hypothetical protein